MNMGGDANNSHEYFEKGCKKNFRRAL